MDGFNLSDVVPKNPVGVEDALMGLEGRWAAVKVVPAGGTTSFSFNRALSLTKMED